MSEAPDVITIGEAISTVQGIAGWLTRAKDGIELSWKDADGSIVVYVPDARRAGFVLRCLLETQGMG